MDEVDEFTFYTNQQQHSISITKEPDKDTGPPNDPFVRLVFTDKNGVEQHVVLSQIETTKLTSALYWIVKNELKKWGL